LICVFCGHDNLPGEDYCVECRADLRDQDIPQARAGIPARLLNETLEQLCKHPPTTVTPETTLYEVLRLLRTKNIGSVVVGQSAPFKGIFTERDCLTKIANHGYDLKKTTVGEVMTRQPLTVESSQPIAAALNAMSAIGVRHLPVVREGQLAEVLSVQDILEYIQDLVASDHASGS
jgi:signal-transduction protein with cAMP-binding, CBS, and nucleotidyltransferase domain